MTSACIPPRRVGVVRAAADRSETIRGSASADAVDVASGEGAGPLLGARGSVVLTVFSFRRGGPGVVGALPCTHVSQNTNSTRHGDVLAALRVTRR